MKADENLFSSPQNISVTGPVEERGIWISKAFYTSSCSELRLSLSLLDTVILQAVLAVITSGLTLSS